MQNQLKNRVQYPIGILAVIPGEHGHRLVSESIVVNTPETERASNIPMNSEEMHAQAAVAVIRSLLN